MGNVKCVSRGACRRGCFFNLNKPSLTELYCSQPNDKDPFIFGMRGGGITDQYVWVNLNTTSNEFIYILS